MKNERQIKKLVLKKQTVHALTPEELEKANGGIVPSHSYICLCPL
ncbi:MAG TPA: class I lanthipeptide [Thermoanaerobaculia bacterium]